MKIGENLRKFRLANKLSQHDIADHLGISQSSYNNHENNHHHFKAEFLPTLGELYKIDASELIPEGTVVRVMNNTNQQNHDQTIIGFDIKMDARALYNDLLKPKDDAISALKKTIVLQQDTIDALKSQV